MKVANFLHAVRSMPVATLRDLTAGQPFMILSPHPDDESLGCGGLIAAACAQQQRVDIVLLTDGAGSHPNSKVYPPDRLAKVRREELRKAGELLGLPSNRQTCLEYPDTRLPSTGDELGTAASRVESLMYETGARSIFVTWRRDSHCDHEAAAAIAVELRSRNPNLLVWAYPIWGWHLDPELDIDEPSPLGVRLDVRPWLSAKKAAIEAHQSQMTSMIDDDPEGFRFSSKLLEPFIGPFEYFIKVPL